MILLTSIYLPNGDIRKDFDVGRILWQMLEERDPIANISHRKMPTMVEHIDHIANRPYLEWRLISVENALHGEFVGQAYITKNYEIGIQIMKAHQRRGYARAALKEFCERYNGSRLLANIAPGNAASRDLFREFGFHHIQNTYEKRDARSDR